MAHASYYIKSYSFVVNGYKQTRMSPLGRTGVVRSIMSPKGSRRTTGRPPGRGMSGGYIGRYHGREDWPAAGGHSEGRNRACSAVVGIATSQYGRQMGDT